MRQFLPLLPAPIRSYFEPSWFWDGPGEYDFWYATSHEEWFWLHLRRAREVTLALTFFATDDGLVDLDLYNLTRAPVHGLRATIANTPLMEIQRLEPRQPRVALHLRDGRSTYFTLAPTSSALGDQWLNESLARLHGSLTEQWLMLHATWPVTRTLLRPHWPDWAGPPPS